MSIERRVVLKGAALGIASLTAGRALGALASLRQLPNAASPVLALVSNSRPAAQTAFLHGANSALGTALRTQQVSFSASVIRNFEHQMRTSESIHLIGLLDDALATLVIDAARSAGARVHWMGLHRATAESTHHRVLSPLVEECSCAHGLSSTQWLMELGHALAAPHAAVSPAAAFESPHVTPITGSYVSFSIEVGRTPHHG